MAEPATRRPVVLDTDIGSDVDDILALVLLARSPELRLVGVTTVYGDTTLRARMTRHVLDLLQLSDVPIGIGARETLTGRPVWWAGHEGAGIPDLARVQSRLSNKQIARALGVSLSTVKNHVHSILGKLGLGCRAEVAVWYSKWGALVGKSVAAHSMEVHVRGISGGV